MASVKSQGIRQGRIGYLVYKPIVKVNKFLCSLVLEHGNNGVLIDQKLTPNRYLKLRTGSSDNGMFTWIE